MAPFLIPSDVVIRVMPPLLDPEVHGSLIQDIQLEYSGQYYYLGHNNYYRALLSVWTFDEFYKGWLVIELVCAVVSKHRSKTGPFLLY